MDQFSLVSHLLEQYINLTTTNHLIFAIVAIKHHAKASSKRQQNPYQSDESKSKKGMLNRIQNNNTISERRRRNAESSYRTKRIKPLKEIEEDDDEFEDTILQKLETIEQNLKKMKQTKEQKEHSRHSDQKTLTLIQEPPKFRTRYFESIKKANQQSSTASKDQHLEKSFHSCFNQSPSAQDQSEQFSFSELSYKPPVSNSSKQKTLREQCSIEDLKRHKFSFPIYLMPAEIVCSCKVEGYETKRFGKRRGRVSFDGNKLNIKKGKRIKVAKSHEKE